MRLVDAFRVGKKTPRYLKARYLGVPQTHFLIRPVRRESKNQKTDYSAVVGSSLGARRESILYEGFNLVQQAKRSI